MPKCPQCNLEIDENIMNCPMCQTELLEQSDKANSESELLINVKDELQANIVEALLKTYEIPIRKRYKGNDTFLKVYMSMTTNGIDIYVPKTALAEARDIINNELVEASELEMDDAQDGGISMEELGREYERKRRIKAWIIILFFTPGILGIIVAIIYTIIVALYYS